MRSESQAQKACQKAWRNEKLLYNLYLYHNELTNEHEAEKQPHVNQEYPGSEPLKMKEIIHRLGI